MQLIIISGQIGSGKTTISKLFRNKGYKHIDSDILAKSLIKKNKVLQERIKGAFNDLVNTSQISVSMIKNILCKSKENKDIINSIVHPIFYNTLNNMLKDYKNDNLVIEVPLIETLANIKYDFTTIVLDTNLSNRTKRYLKKGNSELYFFKKIDSYQKSREFYINNADHIISNNDTMEQLEERFNDLYSILKNE